jgi:hypothetical protein
MLRAILSVIAGYVVIFVFIFATFSVAAIILGNRAYAPGTWDVSSVWLVISFVLGLIAAILGGWACAVIARTATPPKVLAGLVLVLGLLMAAGTLMTQPSEPPAPRPENVGAMDGFQNAKTPPIAAILNPFIGAAGVLIGARFVGRKSPGSR